jgi:serine kinase of HPr protein (carbohydrate metabolism regulator)
MSGTEEAESKVGSYEDNLAQEERARCVLERLPLRASEKQNLGHQLPKSFIPSAAYQQLAVTLVSEIRDATKKDSCHLVTTRFIEPGDT